MEDRDGSVSEHGAEAGSVRQANYLTVRQAARVLGVSSRSVYGYIESGRLASELIDDLLMVRAEDAAAFKRRAPGRVRTVAPRWRLPTEQNPALLTSIEARARPECRERLESTLAELRATGAHRLPGTVRRFIWHAQDDSDEVTIVLVWRGASMPPEPERQAALNSLYADLGEVLDFSSAQIYEGKICLYAD